MGTTAEGCVWDGRESWQDGPGTRSKLVREPPAARDQGLGTSIRQRTDRPHEEPALVTRAARGWAGLPRVLTTEAHRRGNDSTKADRVSNIKRWGRQGCLCLSCDIRDPARRRK